MVCVSAPCATISSHSAGLDSEQLNWGEDEEEDARNQTEPTIAEEQIAEAEGEDGSLPPTPRTTKRNSYNRLSHLSDDKRISFSSMRLSDSRAGTDSNRSSATIKAVQINGTKSFTEVEFEKALRKFASERDSFLADLNNSAGVVLKQPRPRPKTQRIVNDEANNLKSGLGSVRRRISFREMTSVKRQPSVARQGEHLFYIFFPWKLLFCYDIG